ncbi:MAG: methionine--tRNA ligase [Verrucomicrobia bacterium]|nr:MAG: methionine--tRNA ligase [Verrucomicrobiota bacterium]PYL42818.1 MAG: methionine--tRNA ligase [Verrucomicrobiota bacterium]
MPKTFFITTAIDYTNSPPHVGHAYEKVLADVIARYHRLKGDKVFFLTGVDQHGQKVQQSAAKAGIPPAEFVKGITQRFIDLWKKLDVKYDEWAETTSDRHKKVVQGILQRLFDAGQIYKDKQAGYYSVRQEQFLTDKERSPDGQFGAEWGEIEFREEENYYFRLAQHKEWLLSYIDSRKDAVIPDFRQTELRNAVERISGDLCISRPKSRLDWGIELPFDKDFVTYVWFDALTNYISFAGYDPNASAVATGLRPVVTDRSSESVRTAHRAVATTDFDVQPQEFRNKWPALQIIGKDILVPAHGIYWLIMLHAIGFPDKQMPQLLVHGWWNLGGAKMSKSAGNIIDPFALADKYSAEAVRYYLISDIATGKDADFSEERLIERYNADLANNLGNLLNRTLNMVHRYCEGSLRKPRESWKLPADVMDGYKQLVDGYTAATVAVRPEIVIERSLYLASVFNGFIEAQSPWNLAKSPKQEDREFLEDLLYDCAESLRILAMLFSPVLPKAADRIFDQLNWKSELSGKEERFSLADAEWGRLPDRHVVGKPAPLFPRIETT